MVHVTRMMMMVLPVLQVLFSVAICSVFNLEYGELVEQMALSGDFTRQVDLLEAAYNMGETEAFSFISGLAPIDTDSQQVQSLVALIAQNDHVSYLDLLFNANGKLDIHCPRDARKESNPILVNRVSEIFETLSLTESETSYWRSATDNILMIPTANPSLLCFAFVNDEKEARNFPRRKDDFDLWLSLYIQINPSMIGTILLLDTYTGECRLIKVGHENWPIIGLYSYDEDVKSHITLPIAMKFWTDPEQILVEFSVKPTDILVFWPQQVSKALDFSALNGIMAEYSYPEHKESLKDIFSIVKSNFPESNLMLTISINHK